MSLWRTIYRAGGQFSARPAPALIRQSRRTEVRRGKLKLAPPEEMNREQGARIGTADRISDGRICRDHAVQRNAGRGV